MEKFKVWLKSGWIPKKKPAKKRSLFQKLMGVNKTPNKGKRFVFSPLKTTGIVVLALLVSNILAYSVLNLYPALKNWDLETANQWISGSLAVQVIAMITASIALVVVIYRFMKGNSVSLESTGVSKPKSVYALYTVLTFVVYLFVLAFTIVLVSKFIPAINVDQEQEIITAGVGGFGLLPVFLILVILPPLVEEFVFRGFLFSGLRQRFSFWWTTLGVSLAFGALHLSASSEGPLWIAAIDTIILSVFLCYLRERTGNIWAGVGLHFLKNLIAFIGLFIITQ